MRYTIERKLPDLSKDLIDALDERFPVRMPDLKDRGKKITSKTDREEALDEHFKQGFYSNKSSNSGSGEKSKTKTSAKTPKPINPQSPELKGTPVHQPSSSRGKKTDVLDISQDQANVIIETFS